MWDAAPYFGTLLWDAAPYLLRGPGTTIGGFCDSGACLAPFK